MLRANNVASLLPGADERRLACGEAAHPCFRGANGPLVGWPDSIDALADSLQQFHRHRSDPQERACGRAYASALAGRMSRMFALRSWQAPSTRSVGRTRLEPVQPVRNGEYAFAALTVSLSASTGALSVVTLSPAHNTPYEIIVRFNAP